MIYIDGQILLFIQEHLRNPVCDLFFKCITHLGDAGIFWILLTVVLLCFRQTRRAGIYSACALIGSLVVNNLILKNLAGRILLHLQWMLLFLPAIPAPVLPLRFLYSDSCRGSTRSF